MARAQQQFAGPLFVTERCEAALRDYLSRLAAKGSPRSDLEDVCHWLMCRLTSRPGIALWPHAPEQDWSVETAISCVANGSAEFRGHPLVTVSETLLAALLRCADATARNQGTESVCRSL